MLNESRLVPTVSEAKDVAEVDQPTFVQQSAVLKGIKVSGTKKIEDAVLTC